MSQALYRAGAAVLPLRVTSRSPGERYGNE